jgi:hypothetical protein
MRPDDILKEILSDPELESLLPISKGDIESARMDVPSPDSNIEVIKSVIRGVYNGLSPQQTFNEIKAIKKI